ncbi:MAG: bifunctional glycosyltransferase/class I SAM-dependent methyltransferase [Treponema sp.]
MRDGYTGVAVIVQARLGSSRLPQKVLKMLGGKPLLAYTLEMMKNVPAERYILACDYASVQALAPLAETHGYMIAAGSETDVLGRFCSVVKKFENSLRPISIVIRATGDNPFLFWEAAAASVTRFIELGEPDYFTFTGLPHGSGIEVLKARSLLSAEQLTADAYDHEHVGPALYRHLEHFTAIREPAPVQWYYPALRTTVDTPEDFTHAEMIINYLHKNAVPYPYTPHDIVRACRYIERLTVFIPSVKAGQGSGHLRRVCSLMQSLAESMRCVLYIPTGEYPDFVTAVPEEYAITHIVHEIPEKTCLIILDNFKTGKDEMLRLKQIAPVVVIDEGGEGRCSADYVLDILPNLMSGQHTRTAKNTAVQEIAAAANMTKTGFIPLPQTRKTDDYLNRFIRNGRFFFCAEDAGQGTRRETVLGQTKILVVCGGEDAARMAEPLKQALMPLTSDLTVIDPNISGYIPFQVNVQMYKNIENLRERLWEWDIVVTHYGFTAFEALAAGCAVILISPTEYHYRLGIAAGFSVLPPGIPATADFQHIIETGIAMPAAITVHSKQENPADFILKLSNAVVQHCPLCGALPPACPCGRSENKTVCFCDSCGMYYPSFIAAEEKSYSEQYFFDEYQAQYGKTYLEDFDSIKQQGLRRMQHIQQLYARIFKTNEKHLLLNGVNNGTKRILDIGCAYGPFLAAAKESGWNPAGTDISPQAVAYICDTLGIPACQAPFPILPESFPFMLKNTFTGQKTQTVSISLRQKSFAAVTMWFVIEHFQDLDSVLQKVHQLLIPGGIFAFSTPALSGVSGRWNRKHFFAASPTDHYTLWDRRTVVEQLTRYGFLVKKIVSIGHHPERFPYSANIKRNGFLWNILMLISKVFKLGDSMEIYAIKRGSVHDDD